ncbi:AraC family transcriptional regulator [Rhodococcus baikonurensis]|uniref:AraC family transcriptional regulator n=1 Tax=Rhodococcus baikonurensis TaxID=172041 RepID=A0ABV5X7S8_9NOCA
MTELLGLLTKPLVSGWYVRHVPPSDPITAYTIPIQRVQAFVGIALARNWDIDEMLGNAEISADLLTEGRSRVTIQQLGGLIRQLWHVTDDELLGFGLRPVPRGTFRLLCMTVLTATDLQSAIRRFDDFGRAAPGMPPMRVDVENTRAKVSIDISRVEQPVDLLVDTLLAITHRFLAWAIGRRISLQLVQVPYPEPAFVDDYDLLFGAPMEFSAAECALVFDADVLTSPIVRDEASLNEFLRDAPAGVLTRRNYATSVSSRVRTLLAVGLSGEWMTVDEIAAELLMSPQTLRRKLRDENTSPREIKEEILRDAAITSLARGDETVAALSRRLGFSEPSAFSRAFRRWTGSPPGRYQP